MALYNFMNKKLPYHLATILLSENWSCKQEYRVENFPLSFMRNEEKLRKPISGVGEIGKLSCCIQKSIESSRVYLGITIFGELTFEIHIRNLSSMARFKLYGLWKRVLFMKLSFRSKRQNQHFFLYSSNVITVRYKV